MLLALDDFHLKLKTFGLDMDKLQMGVKNSVPEFNLTNGLIAFVVSTLFWATMFHVLHLLVIKPLMLSKQTQKSFPSTKFFKELKSTEQWYYSSFVLGMFHAAFAFTGAVWCFFYADGEVGTTWNHCNYFKHTMFDVQKYLHVISAGYVFSDSLFGIKA